MRLHQFAQSPNPRRVRMFMAEKGIEDVEFVEVDIRAGENLSEAYRAKNPLGVVPTLELGDGTCIGESVAICRYLEGIKPEPSLFGSDPLSQGRIEMWNRGVEFNVLLQVAMSFRNLSGIFADREKTSKEFGEISLERLAQGFDLLDRRLGQTEFVAGDSFSVADITALCSVDFASVVKMPVDDQRPNLQRWHQAVSARPSAGA